jgi:hypothetical protein
MRTHVLTTMWVPWGSGTTGRFQEALSTPWTSLTFKQLTDCKYSFHWLPCLYFTFCTNITLTNCIFFTTYDISEVFTWSLFALQTDQGIRNLSPAKAANISGTDPDYAIRDLYNAIAQRDFPTWSFYIQVMTFEEAEHFKWNPFDLTKVFN